MFNLKKSTPFVENFSKPLEAGQTLTLCGHAHNDADRFDVNITASQGGAIDSGDIAFHMSARFAEKKIVFNSKDGANWGEEERVSLALKPGEHFDVHIRAKPDHYEVWVNRKRVHQFKHRQALNMVRRYGVAGGVDIHHAHVGGGNIPNPFAERVSNPQRIDVQGITEKSPKRFNVNLKDGKGEVICHLSARFDERRIVRNAQLNGAWGQEEHEGEFPFDDDQIFDLTVNNDGSAYQIWVNGTEYARFKHRVRPSVASVEIDGDILITDVDIK